MKSIYKNIGVILIAIFSSITSYASQSPIEFYFSNNRNIIDIENAYHRLIGKEQKNLESKALEIFQHEHIDQGKFINIMGAYYIRDKKVMTADNSEIYFTSKSQRLSRHKIFSVAANLAIELKQESVAVFIPSNKKLIGEIKLTFSSKYPTINEAIKLIRKKLPQAYSRAFSMQLITTSVNYSLVKVDSIDWIGNNMDVSIMKNAFPDEKITYDTGDAYLVFKNGKTYKI